MNKPKIEMQDLALSSLAEDPRNPNHMAVEQLDLLARAIREEGFLQPVLARPSGDGGFILIDGHHRAKAAQAAGLAKIPAVVVHVTAEQAAVMQIGMNKLRGELNLAEVASILNDLHQDGWAVADLALSGYNPEELEDLFKAASNTDDDDVLRGSVQGTSDDAEPAPDTDDAPAVLELVFANVKDRNRAKRALKKAAPGVELGDALLAILDRRDE